MAVHGLHWAPDRYNAAKANLNAAKAKLKAIDAQRQGAKNLADEFARLGRIEAVDDFDLDTPTSAGQLEGEAGRLLRRAKTQHRREGGAHTFSSWREETRDPYELGDVLVNENIRVRGGNIIAYYTLTAERATGIFKNLEGRLSYQGKIYPRAGPGCVGI